MESMELMVTVDMELEGRKEYERERDFIRKLFDSPPHHSFVPSSYVLCYFSIIEDVMLGISTGVFRE